VVDDPCPAGRRRLDGALGLALCHPPLHRLPRYPVHQGLHLGHQPSRLAQCTDQQHMVGHHPNLGQVHLSAELGHGLREGGQPSGRRRNIQQHRQDPRFAWLAQVRRRNVEADHLGEIRIREGAGGCHPASVPRPLTGLSNVPG